MVEVAIAGAKVLAAYFGVSTTTVYTVAAITTAYGTYKVAEDKAKRAEKKARAQNRNRAVELQNMQIDSTAPRRFIYGEMMLNGHLVWQETFGNNNVYLGRVVYLGEGPIDSCSEIYFNDQELTLSSDISGPTGSGTSTAPYSNSFLAQVGKNGGASANVTNSLTQVFINSSNTWDTNCRMEGNAWLMTRMAHNNEVWSAGVPNVRVKVKGRKIYDPRLDGTRGGSGAHRYDNLSTWAWSDNPSLCILDFLINGMEADIDDLDIASFQTAANICDSNVTILNDGGQSTTEKRYRLNGVAFLDTEVISVVEEMLSSCHGALIEEGGTMRLLVPDDTTSAIAANIIEDDVIGEITVNTNAAVQNRINQVAGTFTNAEQLYQETAFAKVKSSNLITEDGKNHLQKIDLPFVTSESQAQRMASIVLKENSLSNSMTLSLKPKFGYLRVGDIVTFVFDPEALGGGSSDPVISSSTKWLVQSLDINPSGEIRATLQEYSDASYTWDTSDQVYLERTALADSFFEKIDQPTYTGFDQFNRIDENGIEHFGLKVTMAHPSHPQLINTQVNIKIDGQFLAGGFLDTQETSLIFDNLTKKKADGTDAVYTLVAFSKTSRGLTSSEAALTTSQRNTVNGLIGPDTTAPARIPNSAITVSSTELVSNNQINVAWTNGVTADINGAYVHIKNVNSAPTGTNIKTAATAFVPGGPGEKLSFNNAGYSASTTYYVFVFMVDRSGNISLAPSGTVSSVAIPAQTAVNNTAVTTTSIGAVATGGAASDVNAGSTTISGAKLTANTVGPTQISVTNLSALNADLGDVTAGTVKAGNIPDANAAPSGGESGAFIDLTNGKFVFGDASKSLNWDGSDLTVTGSIIGTANVATNAITAQFQLNSTSSTFFLGFPNGRDMQSGSGRGYGLRTKIESNGSRINDHVTIQRHLGTINLGQTLTSDTDYNFSVEANMQLGINRRLIATAVDSPHMVPHNVPPEAQLVLRAVCGSAATPTATAASSGDAADNLYWDWMSDGEKYAFEFAGKGLFGMNVHAGLALDNRPAVSPSDASNVVIAKCITSGKVETLSGSSDIAFYLNNNASTSENTNGSNIGNNLTLEIDPISGTNSDLNFPMNAPANSNWPDSGFCAILKKGSYTFSYTSTGGSTVNRTYRDPYWLASYTKISGSEGAITISILDGGDQATSQASLAYRMVPTLLHGNEGETLNAAIAQEIVNGASASNIAQALMHFEVDDEIVYIPKVAYSQTHQEIYNYGAWDHKFFGGSFYQPLTKSGTITIPSGESKVEIILEMIARGGNKNSSDYDTTGSNNWWYNGTHEYYSGSPSGHKHFDSTAANASSLPTGRTFYTEQGPLHGSFGNVNVGLTEFKR